jgi:hypothetical protein
MFLTSLVTVLVLEQAYGQNSISICGNEPIPPGWVTASIYAQGVYTTCRNLVKYTDKAPGSLLNICGDNAPSGWVIVGWASQRCASVGNAIYYGKTIARYDGLAPGSTLTICGDNAPSGWITQSLSARCASVSYSEYIGKVIVRYDGLAPGTTLRICDATAPSGWITQSFDMYWCASIGWSYYYGGVIVKYDGMPLGTTLSVL